MSGQAASARARGGTSCDRCVVVGVGNAFRSDDAAGLEVASRLSGRVPAGVDVITCQQEPSRLLEAFKGAGAALLVDACSSGAEPGTLHRFDAAGAAIPARVFRSSTHAFGVGETIELARALGKLPATVIVYGVEGEEFAAGQGLSPRVEAAVARAAASVLEDLERLTKEEPCTNAQL
jgi:hydrogenase maturation protease